MSKLRRIATTTTLPLIIAAIALGVCISIGFGGTSNREKAGEPSPRAVQLLDALEVAPTRTVSDWAKVADYVVVASVVSEEAIEQPKSETSGDGETMIFREVTLRNASIVWQAPSESKLDVPSQVVVRAMGWVQNTEGEPTELVMESGSRLEVGHTYLVGLVWMPARCSPGDYDAAGWAVIGSGGALPADNDIVGVGEFEGTVLADRPLPPRGTVFEALIGRDPSALAPLMDSVPVAELGTNKVGPFRTGDLGSQCPV